MRTSARQPYSLCGCTPRASANSTAYLRNLHVGLGLAHKHARVRLLILLSRSRPTRHPCTSSLVPCFQGVGNATLIRFTVVIGVRRYGHDPGLDRHGSSMLQLRIRKPQRQPHVSVLQAVVLHGRRQQGAARQLGSIRQSHGAHQPRLDRRTLRQLARVQSTGLVPRLPQCCSPPARSPGTAAQRAISEAANQCSSEQRG